MKRRSPLAQKLWDALAKAEVSLQSRFLLCVSGGSDSMALLHLFKEIIPSSHLHILHCNHGVRTEAHHDAVFVGEQAKLLQIPIHLRIHAGLKQLPSGFQAAAREWRRQEAERLCKLLKLSFIVQGHHREDQLETLLHRILRGTHLSNLQGIKVKQGRWLRPLLGFTKLELRNYLLQYAQIWKEDPSNAESKYTRNYLRHEVIPKLQQVAGGALEQRLQELSLQSLALQEHLQAERENIWTKLCIQDADVLKIRNLELIRLSDLVCWEILHHWLKMNHLNPSFERLQGLAKQVKKSPRTPWCWQIGKGWQVRSKSSQLILEKIVEASTKIPRD
ncbi:MAG: tRNA lysidine(34) synthetase TilS [Deltaproteobacteria bacterium]|nr:tRNA lysidine(34) synthetase TilS [Deltaproteobacteria bacterium]